MRVFVLGGTGSIGAAVTRRLAASGHVVIGLARSAAAEAKLAKLGAVRAIRGNLSTPAAWVHAVPEVDAVIHMACDFSPSMDRIQRQLIEALLPQLRITPHRVRFLFTGGCWLWGNTGTLVATEATPFNPLPAFRWMVPLAQRVLASTEVDGIVIHPGMVYGDHGEGVFRHFAHDAVERPAVRVVGSEAVRWPLVHREDLAELYRLALEQAPAGESYIGAAVDGLAVGAIAGAFAQRFRPAGPQLRVITVDAIVTELGDWARGYALDQQLSGDKARHELGWAPKHMDPLGEIGRMPV